VTDESVRAERLLDAQSKAAQLFDEIEQRGLIRPGVGEKELSDEIRDLAAELLGVKAHWHRRIVRAGENTLQPFKEHPPDRVIADGDIAFLDLGPIFEEWEADFGRTFVPAQEDRGERRRVVRHDRVDQADASHRPAGPGLSLDS
jgi:Xaa-Pro dipeptidase